MTGATQRFDYLLNKVAEADFQTEPFRHIYIEDFFSGEDFREIVTSPEVKLADAAATDAELFRMMYAAGYKIIPFPGCITNEKRYIDWHRSRRGMNHHSATEGAGMTLRLFDAQSQAIAQVKAFIESDSFRQCLADKFEIDSGKTNYDVGIQKYMDGYEISPHPDLRRKALTFMININPGDDSESENHHTHYLRFRPEWQFVQTYWQHNHTIERCWVPWHWCETVREQKRNNSIVVFSPSHDTLHAVKAAYNHLPSQRTQLYGNLWFKSVDVEGRLDWEDFELGTHRKRRTKDRGGFNIFRRIKSASRNLIGRGESENIGRRSDDPYDD